jgi:putative phosphoesterase
MRIAVISDIHGNCLALDAVLADIHQLAIEQIVCLGDAIQGGAQPAETVQRLRALNCPIVMGNADAWLLTGQETSQNEQISESQLATRIWSLAQLSEEDKVWIASFSPTIEIPLEGGKKLLCFHGSPHSFDDILLPDTPEEEFQKLLEGFDATLLCGGHTHTQQWRRLDNAWYFNPGSVGLAYNWRLPDEQFRVDPWADYAIVTSEGEQIGVEFRHVPLDIDELVRVIRASGKPDSERAIKFYRQV